MPVVPRIRLATPGDRAPMQHIEREASRQFRAVGLPAIAEDEPFTFEELDGYLTAGRAWVAVWEDDTVGYLLSDVVDGAAHIEQVSVLPEHQRHGIGRALIDHLATWAAANGMTALTLTTFTDVPWNRPAYERLGFRVLDEPEIGPELRALRGVEAQHGLDPGLRVCMRRGAAVR